jgi:plastocyanin
MNALPFSKLFPLFFLFPFSLLLCGCNQNTAPPNHQNGSASTTVSSEKLIDPATTGSISGTISFAGTPPPRQPIDMDMDPACALSVKGQNLAEAVIVNDGKLENVFIYVKDGLEGYAIPKAAQPAVLDQVGCRYTPHVLGLVAGQRLRILNSDNATHNVHPMAKNNPQWNESQMPKDAPKERTFSNLELLLPITCNQHPWMKMYVNVVGNPFFAVSDGQGNFKIPGLPPGTYTNADVHEKLGTQEMKVTVSPKQDQAVSFTFK